MAKIKSIKGTYNSKSYNIITYDLNSDKVIKALELFYACDNNGLLTSIKDEFNKLDDNITKYNLTKAFNNCGITDIDDEELMNIFYNIVKYYNDSLYNEITNILTGSKSIISVENEKEIIDKESLNTILGYIISFQINSEWNKKNSSNPTSSATNNDMTEDDVNLLLDNMKLELKNNSKFNNTSYNKEICTLIYDTIHNSIDEIFSADKTYFASVDTLALIMKYFESIFNVQDVSNVTSNPNIERDTIETIVSKINENLNKYKSNFVGTSIEEMYDTDMIDLVSSDTDYEIRSSIFLQLTEQLFRYGYIPLAYYTEVYGNIKKNISDCLAKNEDIYDTNKSKVKNDLLVTINELKKAYGRDKVFSNLERIFNSNIVSISIKNNSSVLSYDKLKKAIEDVFSSTFSEYDNNGNIAKLDKCINTYGTQFNKMLYIKKEIFKLIDDSVFNSDDLLKLQSIEKKSEYLDSFINLVYTNTEYKNTFVLLLTSLLKQRNNGEDINNVKFLEEYATVVTSDVLEVINLRKKAAIKDISNKIDSMIDVSNVDIIINDNIYKSLRYDNKNKSILNNDEDIINIIETNNSFATIDVTYNNGESLKFELKYKRDSGIYGTSISKINKIFKNVGLKFFVNSDKLNKFDIINVESAKKHTRGGKASSSVSANNTIVMTNSETPYKKLNYIDLFNLFNITATPQKMANVNENIFLDKLIGQNALNISSGCAEYIAALMYYIYEISTNTKSINTETVQVNVLNNSTFVSLINKSNGNDVTRLNNFNSNEDYYKNFKVDIKEIYNESCKLVNVIVHRLISSVISIVNPNINRDVYYNITESESVNEREKSLFNLRKSEELKKKNNMLFSKYNDDYTDKYNNCIINIDSDSFIIKAYDYIVNNYNKVDRNELSEIDNKLSDIYTQLTNNNYITIDSLVKNIKQKDILTPENIQSLFKANLLTEESKNTLINNTLVLVNELLNIMVNKVSKDDVTFLLQVIFGFNIYKVLELPEANNSTENKTIIDQFIKEYIEEFIKLNNNAIITYINNEVSKYNINFLKNFGKQEINYDLLKKIIANFKKEDSNNNEFYESCVNDIKRLSNIFVNINESVIYNNDEIINKISSYYITFIIDANLKKNGYANLYNNVLNNIFNKYDSTNEIIYKAFSEASFFNQIKTIDLYKTAVLEFNKNFDISLSKVDTIFANNISIAINSTFENTVFRCLLILSNNIKNVKNNSFTTYNELVNIYFSLDDNVKNSVTKDLDNNFLVLFNDQKTNESIVLDEYIKSIFEKNNNANIILSASGKVVTSNINYLKQQNLSKGRSGSLSQFYINKIYNELYNTNNNEEYTLFVDRLNESYKTKIKSYIDNAVKDNTNNKVKTGAELLKKSIDEIHELITNEFIFKLMNYKTFDNLCSILNIKSNESNKSIMACINDCRSTILKSITEDVEINESETQLNKLNKDLTVISDVYNKSLINYVITNLFDNNKIKTKSNIVTDIFNSYIVTDKKFNERLSSLIYNASGKYVKIKKVNDDKTDVILDNNGKNNDKEIFVSFDKNDIEYLKNYLYLLDYVTYIVSPIEQLYNKVKSFKDNSKDNLITGFNNTDIYRFLNAQKYIFDNFIQKMISKFNDFLYDNKDVFKTYNKNTLIKELMSYNESYKKYKKENDKTNSIEKPSLNKEDINFNSIKNIIIEEFIKTFTNETDDIFNSSEDIYNSKETNDYIIPKCKQLNELAERSIDYISKTPFNAYGEFIKPSSNNDLIITSNIFGNINICNDIVTIIFKLKDNPNTKFKLFDSTNINLNNTNAFKLADNNFDNYDFFEQYLFPYNKFVDFVKYNINIISNENEIYKFLDSKSINTQLFSDYYNNEYYIKLHKKSISDSNISRSMGNLFDGNFTTFNYAIPFYNDKEKQINYLAINTVNILDVFNKSNLYYLTKLENRYNTDSDEDIQLDTNTVSDKDKYKIKNKETRILSSIDSENKEYITSILITDVNKRNVIDVLNNIKSSLANFNKSIKRSVLNYIKSNIFSIRYIIEGNAMSITSKTLVNKYNNSIIKKPDSSTDDVIQKIDNNPSANDIIEIIDDMLSIYEFLNGIDAKESANNEDVLVYNGSNNILGGNIIDPETLKKLFQTEAKETYYYKTPVFTYRGYDAHTGTYIYANKTTLSKSLHKVKLGATLTACGYKTQNLIKGKNNNASTKKYLLIDPINDEKTGFIDDIKRYYSDKLINSDLIFDMYIKIYNETFNNTFKLDKSNYIDVVNILLLSNITIEDYSVIIPNNINVYSYLVDNKITISKDAITTFIDKVNNSNKDPRFKETLSIFETLYNKVIENDSYKKNIHVMFYLIDNILTIDSNKIDIMSIYIRETLFKSNKTKDNTDYYNKIMSILTSKTK